MQIVIDIPDKTYDYITQYQDVNGWGANTVTNAILRGTPLPKGHGRIVDANRVLENGDNWEVETALMQTETIIEADKAERSGNE